MPARVSIFLFGYIVLFTSLFVVSQVWQFRIIDRDLNVLVGVYSMVGFIYSVVSAFVIQSKWQVWDRLVEASHGEISSLRQLHWLVRHLPLRRHGEVREKMKAYVEALVKTPGKIGMAKTDTIMQLEEAVFLLDDQRVATLAYDLLSKMMHWREQRENYSRRKTPGVLKTFLFFGGVMISLMSLLLPVHQAMIRYVFTLGLGLLAFTMYLMIDDLDHPYRPGGWHLSDREYKTLLEEIRQYAE